MASIRKLKKDINVLTYDMLARCYSLKNSESSITDERFEEVIRKIVFLRNDLVLRTNHPETNAESGSLGDHYRKVKEDLYELGRVIEELKSKKD
jgi:uncharacterized protein YutE (UPF0331/DUF86 family)